MYWKPSSAAKAYITTHNNKNKLYTSYFVFCADARDEGLSASSVKEEMQ